MEFESPEIRSFISYIKNERRLSEHTIVSYQNDLRQFTTFLEENGGTYILQIHRNDVRAWMVDLLDKGLSKNAINRKLACLRSLFKFFLREEFLTVNPMDSVSSYRLPKKTAVFVRVKEMDSLLDAFDFPDSFGGLRDKTVLELFYGCGMRRAELTNIRHKDLDMYNRRVKLMGKGGKERMAPINKTLYYALQEYLKEKENSFGKSAPEEPLIVTNAGKKTYPMFLYRLVNKYLLAASTVEKKSPHVLRHSFATHLLNRGAGLRDVQELMGHASLSSTQIYTHNSIDKLKEIYDQAHPKA